MEKLHFVHFSGHFRNSLFNGPVFFRINVQTDEGDERVPSLIF